MGKSKNRHFTKQSAFSKAKTKTEDGKFQAYRVIVACSLAADSPNEFKWREEFAEVKFSGRVCALLGVARRRTSWTKIKNLIQTWKLVPIIHALLAIPRCQRLSNMPDDLVRHAIEPPQHQVAINSNDDDPIDDDDIDYQAQPPAYDGFEIDPMCDNAPQVAAPAAATRTESLPLPSRSANQIKIRELDGVIAMYNGWITNPNHEIQKNMKRYQISLDKLRAAKNKFEQLRANLQQEEEELEELGAALERALN